MNDWLVAQSLARDTLTQELQAEREMRSEGDQLVMLLGAQAILAGARPEIAQSIVALGIDLRSFTTYATLEAALAQLESRA